MCFLTHMQECLEQRQHLFVSTGGHHLGMKLHPAHERAIIFFHAFHNPIRCLGCDMETICCILDTLMMPGIHHGFFAKNAGKEGILLNGNSMDGLFAGPLLIMLNGMGILTWDILVQCASICHIDGLQTFADAKNRD